MVEHISNESEDVRNCIRLLLKFINKLNMVIKLEKSGLIRVFKALETS